MKGKAFRFGMWIFLLVGGVALFFSTIFLNPYQSVESFRLSMVGVGLFYVSTSIFLTGVFSLILFWIRRKAMTEEEFQSINVGVSFRQGLLLSIAVILILVMQSFRVLVWWDALLAVGTIMMIELYFLAR